MSLEKLIRSKLQPVYGDLDLCTLIVRWRAAEGVGWTKLWNRAYWTAY